MLLPGFCIVPLWAHDLTHWRPNPRAAGNPVLNSSPVQGEDPVRQPEPELVAGCSPDAEGDGSCGADVPPKAGRVAGLVIEILACGEVWPSPCESNA
jgi:hypothetical protein